MYNNKNAYLARYFLCLKGHWLRGLDQEEEEEEEEEEEDKLIKKESKLRTIHDLREYLWIKDDNTLYDEAGSHLLIFAVALNNIAVVKEIVARTDDISRDKIVIPNMDNELHFISGWSILTIGMFIASPDIIAILLNAGFNPYFRDKKIDLDCFNAGVISGRVENVKLWLKRLPKWDINRTLSWNGVNNLQIACGMGSSHHYEMIKFLLKLDVNVDHINQRGKSCIYFLTDNINCDPRTLKLLLSRTKVSVNHRALPLNVKWKAVALISKLGRNYSNILRYLSEETLSTPLMRACRRGDLEIVDILLRNGSDISIKNDLGHTALSQCQAFPEMRGALDRIKREMEYEKMKMLSHISIKRRNSIAVKTDTLMYLMSLNDMLIKERDGTLLGVKHEILQEHLICFEDLPLDARIIYVSHEWLSKAHPDPNGAHLNVLCRTLERLLSGCVDRVEMSTMYVFEFIPLFLFLSLSFIIDKVYSFIIDKVYDLCSH